MRARHFAFGVSLLIGTICCCNSAAWSEPNPIVVNGVTAGSANGTVSTTKANDSIVVTFASDSQSIRLILSKSKAEALRNRFSELGHGGGSAALFDDGKINVSCAGTEQTNNGYIAVVRDGKTVLVKSSSSNSGFVPTLLIAMQNSDGPDLKAVSISVDNETLIEIAQAISKFI